MTTTEKYYFGYGRRKTSIASCRAFMSIDLSDNIKAQINGIDILTYFSSLGKNHIEKQINRCFSASTEPRKKLLFVVNVSGGGISSQLEAVMFAIANSVAAFLFANRMNNQKAEIKYVMRKNGLLTFDNRQKEKKKPGQPKARRKRQFSKR